jgi:hypothetical protein
VEDFDMAQVHSWVAAEEALVTWEGRSEWQTRSRRDLLRQTSGHDPEKDQRGIGSPSFTITSPATKLRHLLRGGAAPRRTRKHDNNIPSGKRNAQRSVSIAPPRTLASLGKAPFAGVLRP